MSENDEMVTVTIPVKADAIPADGPRREQFAGMVGELVLAAAETRGSWSWPGPTPPARP